MRQHNSSSLRDLLRDTGDLTGRMLLGADASVSLAEIMDGTTLGLPLSEFLKDMFERAVATPVVAPRSPVSAPKSPVSG